MERRGIDPGLRLEHSALMTEIVSINDSRQPRHPGHSFPVSWFARTLTGLRLVRGMLSMTKQGIGLECLPAVRGVSPRNRRNNIVDSVGDDALEPSKCNRAC